VISQIGEHTHLAISSLLNNSVKLLLQLLSQLTQFLVEVRFTLDPPVQQIIHPNFDLVENLLQGFKLGKFFSYHLFLQLGYICRTFELFQIWLLVWTILLSLGRLLDILSRSFLLVLIVRLGLINLKIVLKFYLSIFLVICLLEISWFWSRSGSELARALLLLQSSFLVRISNFLGHFLLLLDRYGVHLRFFVHLCTLIHKMWLIWSKILVFFAILLHLRSLTSVLQL